MKPKHDTPAEVRLATMARLFADTFRRRDATKRTAEASRELDEQLELEPRPNSPSDLGF